jgi:hypothetical protein
LSFSFSFLSIFESHCHLALIQSFLDGKRNPQAARGWDGREMSWRDLPADVLLLPATAGTRGQAGIQTADGSSGLHNLFFFISGTACGLLAEERGLRREYFRDCEYQIVYFSSRHGVMVPEPRKVLQSVTVGQ